MKKKKSQKKVSPAKKAAAKAPSRKTAAGKKSTPTASKKISKKTAGVPPKKTAAKHANKKKKASVKKAKSATSSAAKKKSAQKTTATKKTGATKKAVKKTAAKKTAAPKKASSTKAKPVASRKGSAGSGAAKSRPIAFSLEEAREVARSRSAQAEKAPRKTAPAAARKAAAQSEEPKQEARVLGAASLTDILGRNPHSDKHPAVAAEKEVPKKFAPYFKLLIELRDHVLTELDLHTKDTLKRSSKEDSGDLSSYSQHMADAGTDSFDRDFALSLVSSEQEALSEIEAAISRIHKGTYGICEITGKPIRKERLLAVPFARYSVEGQAEYEKGVRRPAQRGGAYLDSSDDTNEFFSEDSED